ncbi:hypothetical protein B0H10DRAFT_2314925 [Mycena sp. CBHHK59/15]|nr:hypothetical protein B0H10DRAFT_2314925 [Mycena sp. CBHHK59/15]
MTDQCALDANGNLRDASEIDFYESESDTKALPAKSGVNLTQTIELRRGTRKRETDKLTKSLKAQKADDDGNPFIDRPKRTRATTTRVKKVPESISDQEDDDYEIPDLIEASDSEASDDEMDIDNEEIASLLTSKTIPRRSTSTNSKPQTRAKATGVTSSGKRQRATVEEVEDEDDPPKTRNTAPTTKKSRRATVEQVEDEDDSPKVIAPKFGWLCRFPGDKHYRCFHGNREIITISKASNSNVMKLIRHLKNHFPVMHRLYCALHARGRPPTEDEIKFAQGAAPIDGAAAKEYLGKVETATSSIIKGLEQQAKKVRVRALCFSLFIY